MRTNDVMTPVKGILCDNVFNILSLRIREDMTRLASSGRPTPLARSGPTRLDISGFHVLPLSHLHLDPPRGTVYWNLRLRA